LAFVQYQFNHTQFSLLYICFKN